MTACEEHKRLRAGILWLCLLAISAFLVVEIYDLDIWWHLGIGRDIIATGRVPTIDYYSVAGFGRPYHDSHWLFQVVVALAERLVGLTGVQLVMILIWSAGLHACWRALRDSKLSPALAALCLVPVALACTERFLPRPEIVSLALLAIFYERLQRGAYTQKIELLIFFVLQILWSNAHGLFVLGPCLVGAYWVVAAILPAARKALPSLTRLLLVILLATLITPFGFAGWKYAWLLFTEVGSNAPQLLKSVGELSPTFGAANRSGFAFWFYLVLLAATVLAGGAALWRRQVAWPRLLIVLAMLGLSLTGRRNMALLALVAAPFAAEQLPAVWRERLEDRLGRPLYAGSMMVLLLVLLWYPLSGHYYLKMEFPARSGFGATPSFFPYGLQAFLDRSHFTGQVYNSNILGGFYLYQAPPGSRSFSDGRWEIYPADAFEKISRGVQNAGAWKHFAASNGIQGILLQHASLEAKALLPLLRQNPEWKLVYFDHAASFWVPAAQRDLPAPLDPNVAVPSSSARRIDDALILDLFYKGMQAWPGRLRNVQTGLSFDADNRYLLAALGETELKLGQMAAAEATYLRLYRMDDQNIPALNELAFFAYQRGDVAQAVALLQRVLALDPAHADARANLQRISEAQQGVQR